MRTNGVDERYCTGDATPKEKFDAWAATVPKTLRNPLYHWTHLELNRPFGINDKLLSSATADEIWQRGNAQLPDLSTHKIFEAMKVEVVCTTDDPVDDLAHHAAHAANDCPTKMLPTFRPDKKALPGNDVAGYNAYLDVLTTVSGVSISTHDDLLAAMKIVTIVFSAWLPPV